MSSLQNDLGSTCLFTRLEEDSSSLVNKQVDLGSAAPVTERNSNKAAKPSTLTMGETCQTKSSLHPFQDGKHSSCPNPPDRSLNRKDTELREGFAQSVARG